MSNLYAAPGSNLSTLDSGVETTMFSFDGRIGRVRVVAYFCSMYLLSTLGVGAGVLGLQFVYAGVRHGLGQWGPLITLGIMLIWMCVLARRRLQDLNLHPIWMLAGFIPLVNLYFLYLMVLKRGDAGRNDYGPAPAPNTPGMFALAGIAPMLAAFGLLFAILDKFYPVR